jgi:hypothetical protein
MFSTTRIKSSNIEFYTNPFCGRRVVPCVRTGMKLIVAFLNFANAPNSDFGWDVGRSACDLIWGDVPLFAWRDLKIFGVAAEIRTAHFPNGRQKRYRFNRLLSLHMRPTVLRCSSSSNIACCHLTCSYPLDATNCALFDSLALVPTIVVTRLCAVREHGRLLTDVASCANYRLWRWIVRR